MLTVKGDLQLERLKMSIGQESGDILNRERERRFNALDLANCPGTLQDPADYLQGEAEMQSERRSGEEDVVVSESSVPSSYSDGQDDGEGLHCDTEDDSVGVVAGPSTGNNMAYGMSCPMPMGPYQPDKHATPSLGTNHDDDDDCWCGYCVGSLLVCWNHCWWTWGCSCCMCGEPRTG